MKETQDLGCFDVERTSELLKAQYFLKALVKALDGAFISSWQSSHYWDKELDEARQYLRNNTDQY